MKKRIILFVLSVSLIIGMLSAGNAYAWFSSLEGGSAVANTLTAGEITLSLGDSAFIWETDDIYPEQNLLDGSLSFSSSSNIPTCIRVKVTYTYGGQTLTWDPTDADCELSVTYDTGAWSYSSDYLYYGGTSGSLAAGSATIPLFSKICYSGDNTDNDSLAGQSATVTVLYEVRQSDYMTSWS